MQLRRFPIDPDLRPYLALIWVFECTDGIPQNDLRVIAPNGEMKLIVPFRNWLSSTNGGPVRMHAPSTVSIVGQQTLPVVIDGPRVNGTIGITFKPSGAYRFFPVSLHELADRTVLSNEIFGTEGKVEFCSTQPTRNTSRKMSICSTSWSSSPN